MLVLDYNEERSLQTSLNGIKDESIKNSLSRTTMKFDTAREGVQAVSAKVQINTLSPFIHFGGGTFMMTDVKKMTSTDDFLEMPMIDKKCDIELYEDCRTRRLLEGCNCVPWEVTGFKVGILYV